MNILESQIILKQHWCSLQLKFGNHLSKMADVYFNKCIYCQDDINGLRIQCCVCEDIVLCLQCFAAGAEFGTHKRNHAYQFTDDWPNNIIVKGEGDWTVSEESRLLNNIEVLGFGNWDGVSAIMTNRTPQEIKDHYLSRFLDGVIGRATWAGIQRPDLSKNTDLPINEKKPIVPRLPPLDITLEEAQLLSYMPKRDDFDRETSTDIEAEQLVSSLNGIAIDNEVLDTALKLAQVDMYMRRLRERARRKRIVKDYQLIAKFFASHRKHASKPSYTKEQREFRDRMRVFSQFSTATEHECLISGLEREQELKLRLNELARYRQAGLTHMDECVHYEQHLAFDRRNQTIAPTAITPATHQWKHAKSQWIRSILPGSASSRKKRKRKRLKFHRPKVHVPHRRHLYKRKPRNPKHNTNNSEATSGTPTNTVDGIVISNDSHQSG